MGQERENSQPPGRSPSWPSFLHSGCHRWGSGGRCSDTGVHRGSPGLHGQRRGGPTEWPHSQPCLGRCLPATGEGRHRSGHKGPCCGEEEMAKQVLEGGGGGGIQGSLSRSAKRTGFPHEYPGGTLCVSWSQSSLERPLAQWQTAGGYCFCPPRPGCRHSGSAEISLLFGKVSLRAAQPSFQGGRALQRPPAAWFPSSCRPILLVRAARHYEGAEQILIRRAILLSCRFISLWQVELPPLGCWVRVECPARIDLSGMARAGWSPGLNTWLNSVWFAAWREPGGPGQLG